MLIWESGFFAFSDLYPRKYLPFKRKKRIWFSFLPHVYSNSFSIRLTYSNLFLSRPLFSSSSHPSSSDLSQALISFLLSLSFLPLIHFLPSLKSSYCFFLSSHLPLYAAVHDSFIHTLLKLICLFSSLLLQPLSFTPPLSLSFSSTRNTFWRWSGARSSCCSQWRRWRGFSLLMTSTCPMRKPW